MGDNNPTVEVNGTELEIIETEDGFEAREAEPDPNTVEKFEDEVAEYSDSLSVGSISELEQARSFDGTPNGVKVHVSDSEYDVMVGILDDARDAGWLAKKIEYEHGYALFRDEDAE